jgi:uncharacterized damage-inducible protein DinB
MAANSNEPMSTALQTLFAYKAWANDELFAALESINAAAHPSAVHAAIRILNHAHVVDCIFKGHLSGMPHGYQATNTQETPALPTRRRCA